MGLELHHLQLSQSDRIVWLLEEMGVPYDLIIYERDLKTGVAPASLKKLTPAETAPYFRDTSVSPPVELVESGAIAQYILEVYGPNAPGNRMSRGPRDAEFPAYLNWFHFASGSLMSALSRASSITGGKPGPTSDRFKRYIKMMDDQLAKSKYLAGEEASAADCMTVTIVTTIRGFMPVNLGPYPNILRYLKDVAARPAYRRSLEKGDNGMEPMIEAETRRFYQFEAYTQLLKDAQAL